MLTANADPRLTQISNVTAQTVSRSRNLSRTTPTKTEIPLAEQPKTKIVVHCAKIDSDDNTVALPTFIEVL